jgi:hypothetical protein
VSGRDEAGRMSPWDVLLCRRSGGGVVFVDESAEDPAPVDPVDGDGFGCGVVDGGGGALVDATVGPVAVVVLEGLDE